MPNFPIYLAILTPLLIGLLLGFIIYVLKDLSKDLTIREHRDRIKNLKKDLAEITRKAHKLEIENNKLKGELGKDQDENSI